MRVQLSTPLSAPPEWVAAQLQSTAVFRHITAPLIQFRPAQGKEWPTHWAPGELALHMRLLGVLPMGPQTVRISIEPPTQVGGWPTLRDNGEGALMRRWDHRITLQPLPDGRTLYTDDIEVVARHLPWLMTPLSALFARVFYRHRQGRWRTLAAQHAQKNEQNQEAPFNAPTFLQQKRRAFDYLLNGFATRPAEVPAMRWRWLEAAHVLGQTSLALHWRSHCEMLRYAIKLRDTREAVGQITRLALVLPGHLLARLPRGNIGRAHIHPFQSMAPPEEIIGLVEKALAAHMVQAEPEQ